MLTTTRLDDVAFQFCDADDKFHDFLSFGNLWPLSPWRPLNDACKMPLKTEHLHTRPLLTMTLGLLAVILSAQSSAADDEADRLAPGPPDELTVQAEAAAEADDPGELPRGVTQAKHDDQVAVDDFLQPVISNEGLGVWASVDWNKAVINLSASVGSAKSLAMYDGQKVHGLTVKVTDAVVSRAAYEQAIQKLGQSASQLPLEIRSFSLPSTSRYMDIQVRDLHTTPREVQTKAEEQIQRIINVPFQLSEASEDRWVNRGNSAAPWRGGVQMRHAIGPGAYACSTAFPVVKNGTGYILSAAHCDHTTSAPHWSWRDWADDSWIAYSSGIVGKSPKKTLDSLLIDPKGGTEGRIYSGAWNASSGTSRYLMSVNGAGSTYIGSPVCTNGANSGQHCNLEVFTNNDVACASQGVCHRWIAFHNSILGTATADADSGGSVYFDRGGDRVGARGVMSQARGITTTCGSTRFGSASICTNGVLFVGIIDILQKWDVAIETS